MMSSRHGLAANPSRLPMKAMYHYVSFSHFDICLRLCACLGHQDVIKLIHFHVII
jgi:hypothetical protein